MLRSLRATQALALSVAFTVPTSIPRSAPEPSTSAALVVEVDECKCDSFLQFEPTSGDTNPWVLSWTPDEGHEDGSCAAGGCDDVREPRPCSGKFRIQVTWPLCPTPPCGTTAAVGYKPYGANYFSMMGELSPVQESVFIRNAGDALLICATVALGDEPFLEPDDTLSEILITCATEEGLYYSRWIKVREGCMPCAALPE